MLASHVDAQPTPRRIAFVNVGPAAANVANVAAFQAGLREAGLGDGRVVVDYRWADGRIERLPALVGELVALKPDVIVSTGGPPTVQAVKVATRTIPVVFITGDPVAEGVVTSLAKPDGNLTGVAVLAEEVDAKRLEILKEAVPALKKVAVIANPSARLARQRSDAFRAAAERAGVAIQIFEARNAAELDRVFTAVAAAKADGLAVIPDSVLGFERARIVEFALQNRLPGIYFWREFAQGGGLLSYGTSLPAAYRRSATYVDRILRGAKPADLPVEQPSTFELVVNLGTAKALGIALPPSLVGRADVVIP